MRVRPFTRRSWARRPLVARLDFGPALSIILLPIALMLLHLFAASGEKCLCSAAPTVWAPHAMEMDEEPVASIRVTHGYVQIEGALEAIGDVQTRMGPSETAPPVLLDSVVSVLAKRARGRVLIFVDPEVPAGVVKSVSLSVVRAGDTTAFAVFK